MSYFFLQILADVQLIGWMVMDIHRMFIRLGATLIPWHLIVTAFLISRER